MATQKFPPQEFSLYQRTLCDSLDLRGRVLVSEHEIKGTVGGEIKDLTNDIKSNKEYAPLKGIERKCSKGIRVHVLPAMRCRWTVSTLNSARVPQYLGSCTPNCGHRRHHLHGAPEANTY